MLDGLNWLVGLYRMTIGFLFYKAAFRIQKKFGMMQSYKHTRGLEFFGKRSTLQIVLFVVAVIVMIPHSKLYTRDLDRTPGQETLLYKVIGPEDEIEDIEEVLAYAEIPIIENDLGWRQRAVSVDTPAGPAGEVVIAPEEITNVSTGGSAIAKPTILPGTTLPQTEGATAGERSEPLYYTVQPGDTVGSIAERFDLYAITILWANNLTSRSYIRPGDRLLILPVDGVVHTVKRGDTLGKIAGLYGAEAEKIVKQNRLQNDGSDIVVGEELIIPGGEKIQAASQSTPSQPRQYTSLSSIAAPPPSASIPAGSNYLWPTSVRRITQYYGWRHTGVDIAGPSGTPLYATKAGTVIKSQCGWNGGYGCYIIIDHGGGIASLYGHASQLYVSVGQQIAQGQTIALMGSTGRSTGPHVHFEIRVGGSRVNPFQYIR